MSNGEDSSIHELQRPTNNDPAAWRVYWSKLGQGWRTEPEIDEERQEELARLRSPVTDPTLTEFPFEGMKLTRADVEWLLASHEEGRGPVDLRDEQHRSRWGLDLRGADLRGANLSGLPLAHLLAGIRPGEPPIHLEGADLTGAQLEGADLVGAHLEGTDLADAHLEKADLRLAHLEGVFVMGPPVHLEGARLLQAYMEGARLAFAHLQGADLGFAHLENADLHNTHLENVELGGAHLEGADLRNVHLEGASLGSVYLGGKELDAAGLERVHRWNEGVQQNLPPANLRSAFFDAATNLGGIQLGDAERGTPQLADVCWGGANLAVVDWGPAVNNLGDERAARDLEASKAHYPMISAAAIVQDYQLSVRANRQLAVVLREQGMNEVADNFAYRAQVLQRRIYELHEVYGFQQQLGQLFLSYFLWLIAGYGYRVGRTLVWYIGVILMCALLYYLLGETMTLREAVVGSVTAFHGRGLFETQLTPGQSLVAAFEAFFGLVIEVALIATFTWRFFGR